jgi:DinB family protein
MQTAAVLQQLAEGRDAVVGATEGLSEAQLRFAPGTDRWSIADVLEHLARVEDFFVQRIAGRLADPTPPVSRALTDDQIVEWERDPAYTVVVAGRVSLGAAPPPIRPTGWLARDSLDGFLSGRDRTAAFVRSTPGLRDVTFEHPALGALDVHQWALFVAAHTARHLTQIAAIKRASGYPCDTCS